MLSEIGSVGMFAPHLEDSTAKPKLWVLVIAQSQRSGRQSSGLAQKLSSMKFGHDKYYDIAVRWNGDRRKLAQKGIYPNIDFLIPVYRKLGFPKTCFT